MPTRFHCNWCGNEFEEPNAQVCPNCGQYGYVIDRSPLDQPTRISYVPGPSDVEVEREGLKMPMKDH